MSSDEFWSSQFWQVYMLVFTGLKIQRERDRGKYERARMIMSAMTDTSKLKFPWEDEVKKSFFDYDDEDQEFILRRIKQMDEAHGRK